MKRCPLLVSVTALFVVCSLTRSALAKEYTLADIEKVEKKAIANRERIKNWHLKLAIRYEIDTTTPEFDPDKQDERGKCVGLEICKDSDMFREDRFFQINGHINRYVRLLGKQWMYLYAEQKEHDGPPAIQVFSRDFLTTPPAKLPLYYDTKMLGFVPGDIRSFPEELTLFIRNAQRKNLTMTDAELNGQKCYKIDFGFVGNDNSYSVWLASEKDNNPIRFDFVFPGEHSAFFEIDYQKHASSGLWFPEMLRTSAKKGERQVFQEVVDIEVISLNEKLTPDLFSEKGLNLPIGTLVLMNPEEIPDTYTWDGEKIVGLSGFTPTIPVAIEPAKWDARRILLLVSGILLIAIALWKIYQEHRKKRT